MQIEQVLGRALTDPEAALESLQAAKAERKLIEYIKFLWPVLEPGRKLVTGWALDAICDHLQAVTDGHIKRLIINVPPGCTKSLTTDVFWPSWEWGPKNLPHYRYLAASYSEALTIRDNRRCRSLIQSPLYQKYWGNRFEIVSEQNAKQRFDTNKTGFKIATSVGGASTGERGDRIIIDDPHNVKNAESQLIREATLQWFTEVMSTRINDALTSAIVLIMQRVHERDVTGLILASELGYDILCLPMEYESDHPHLSRTALNFVDPRKQDGELLWPGRFPEEYLETDLKPSLRAWGGSYAEAGQLQQRPSPRGGGMFKRDDLRIVDKAPKSGIRCRGWDLASSKDGHAAYTACAKICLVDGTVYIEDVYRFRGSPGEVYDKIKYYTRLDGHDCTPSIPQDPGAVGKYSVASIARECFHGYKFYSNPESGQKDDRARPLANQAEVGNVALVRGSWNDTFIDEATLFPNSAFKDQVDAASRAYHYITIADRPIQIGGCPEVIEG